MYIYCNAPVHRLIGPRLQLFVGERAVIDGLSVDYYGELGSGSAPAERTYTRGQDSHLCKVNYNVQNRLGGEDYRPPASPCLL